MNSVYVLMCVYVCVYTSDVCVCVCVCACERQHCRRFKDKVH